MSFDETAEPLLFIPDKFVVKDDSNKNIADDDSDIEAEIKFLNSRDAAGTTGTRKKRSEIIRYSGISLGYVIKLWEAILKDEYHPAKNLQLFTVQNNVYSDHIEGEDLDKVLLLSAGSTVQLVEIDFFNSDVYICAKPGHESEIRLSRRNLLPKRREKWSIADIAEFIVVPRTAIHKQCFIDLLDKKFVGEKFKGAFVSQARQCDFDELIEALKLHFDDEHKKNMIKLAKENIEKGLEAAENESILTDKTYKGQNGNLWDSASAHSNSNLSYQMPYRSNTRRSKNRKGQNNSFLVSSINTIRSGLNFTGRTLNRQRVSKKRSSNTMGLKQNKNIRRSGTAHSSFVEMATESGISKIATLRSSHGTDRVSKVTSLAVADSKSNVAKDTQSEPAFNHSTSNISDLSQNIDKFFIESKKNRSRKGRSKGNRAFSTVSMLTSTVSDMSLSAENQVDFTQCFVWIDIFCANQVLLCNPDPELDDTIQEQRVTLLNEGLHFAIKKFDARLLFVDSFQKPAPLSRAWCIWEMYGVANCKRNMDIICSKRTTSTLEKMIERRRFDMLSILSNLNVQELKCANKSDLRLIKSAVDKLPGGFSDVKQAVTLSLRRWFFTSIHEIQQKRFRNFDFSIKSAKAADAYKFSKKDADFLSTIGGLFCDFNEFDMADNYEKFALCVYLQFPTTENMVELSDVYASLGRVELYRKNYIKAEEYFKQSLDLRKNCGSKPSLMVKIAAAQHNLGLVYSRMKDFDKSLECYEKAENIYSKNLSELHVGGYAQTLINIGEIFFIKRDFKSALEFYFKSVNLSKKHPKCNRGLDLILTHIGLGQVYTETKQLEEASESYNQALRLQLELYGRDVQTARIYILMGDVQLRRNDVKHLFHYVSAIRILEAQEDSVPSKNELLIEVYRKYYTALVIEKDFELAKEFCQKRLYLSKCVYETNHIDIGEALADLGSCCLRTRDYEKAKECLLLAVESFKPLLVNQERFKLACVHITLGNVFCELKSSTQAYSEFLAAKDILVNLPGNRHDSASERRRIESLMITYDKLAKVAAILLRSEDEQRWVRELELIKMNNTL